MIGDETRDPLKLLGSELRKPINHDEHCDLRDSGRCDCTLADAMAALQTIEFLMNQLAAEEFEQAANEGFREEHNAARNERIAELEAVLEDFRDHGLRADTAPTTSLRMDTAQIHAFYADYLRRADERVRERARQALEPR